MLGRGQTRRFWCPSGIYRQTTALSSHPADLEFIASRGPRIRKPQSCIGYCLHNSPPAYPGEAGYGGASLTRRTAAHDTPSLQCELCLCFKNACFNREEGKSYTHPRARARRGRSRCTSVPQYRWVGACRPTVRGGRGDDHDRRTQEATRGTRHHTNYTQVVTTVSRPHSKCLCAVHVVNTHK